MLQMKGLGNCPGSWVHIKFLISEAVCVLAVPAASRCSRAVVVCWYQLSPSGFIDGVHLHTLSARFCCVPAFLTSHQVSAAFRACENLLFSLYEVKRGCFPSNSNSFFLQKHCAFLQTCQPFCFQVTQPPKEGNNLLSALIQGKDLWKGGVQAGRDATAAWEGHSLLWWVVCRQPGKLCPLQLQNCRAVPWKIASVGPIAKMKLKWRQKGVRHKDKPSLSQGSQIGHILYCIWEKKHELVWTGGCQRALNHVSTDEQASLQAPSWCGGVNIHPDVSTVSSSTSLGKQPLPKVGNYRVNHLRGGIVRPLHRRSLAC